MPARSAQDKVTAAKRVATAAHNKAVKIAKDESRNRSTRTRSAYKTKADALDKVREILG